MAYDTRAQALRKALLLIREAIIFVYVALGQYFLFFLFYFFFSSFPFFLSITRDTFRTDADSWQFRKGVRRVSDQFRLSAFPLHKSIVRSGAPGRSVTGRYRKVLLFNILSDACCLFSIFGQQILLVAH